MPRLNESVSRPASRIAPDVPATSSQLNRCHSILQRKPVRDQVRKIEPITIPRKNHLRHIILNRNRSAVRPHQRLLIYTDGRRIERSLAMLGLRK